jgi:uncharacterized membrane protein
MHAALSLKSVLLAKHAQHVVLIHFPIALFLIGVLFDFAARWRRREALATVAFYNIVVAAIFVVPVMITGFLAWRWQLEGQRLHGLLLFHLIFGCTSGALIMVSAWLQIRARRAPGADGFNYRFPVEFAGALVVAMTAHLGGFLSGVNSAT